MEGRSRTRSPARRRPGGRRGRGRRRCSGSRHGTCGTAGDDKHQRKRAISSAIAACDSRPSTERHPRARRWPSGTAGEETLLHPAVSGKALFDVREREALLFDRVDQRLERRELEVGIAAADEHAIAAGGDRLDARLRHRPPRRDRLHLHVVGEDDAVEVQLVAQDVGDDAARQRGGPLRVERGHEHVRRDDGADARRDRGFERHETRPRAGGPAGARRAAGRGASRLTYRRGPGSVCRTRRSPPPGAR